MISLPTHKRHARPIGIDLFAGAGGLSLGFEQAGFDVKAAVEIDPVHAAVHEFNFPQCTSICADASSLTGAEIRRAAHLGNTPIDVVFGGAPCQGFSLIGKRAIDDPRNRLLLEFVRLTTELDASYFVFENVKGITIGQHKLLLEELVETFQEKGYRVLLPYRVLNAVDFGVPQDRQRMFLIGAKAGFPLPKYPAPSQAARVTVWEAIADLPEVDDNPDLIESDETPNPVYGKPSPYAGSLRGLFPQPNDFSYPRVWDRKWLTSSMRTIHTETSKARFQTTLPGQIEPISRFLKLNANGICNTLRAGTGSDKGAFTSPRPIHPFSSRCITVREAARLHSYPDWFRFHMTKWHGFRQIGNSVPPLLGRAVASQLIEALGIQPTRPESTLSLGPESLLSMTVSTAARHYGVSSTVVGRRLRVPDRHEIDQLSFATA